MWSCGSSMPWSISRKSSLSWSGSSCEDALPDAALLEDLDRQVVEVDLEDADAVLGRELVLDPLLRLRDRERVLGRVRVDEERDLVAQALHLQEALAAEHREQVLLLLGQVVGVIAQPLPSAAVGKKRMSLGVRAPSTSATRVGQHGRHDVPASDSRLGLHAAS